MRIRMAVLASVVALATVTGGHASAAPGDCGQALAPTIGAAHHVKGHGISCGGRSRGSHLLVQTRSARGRISTLRACESRGTPTARPFSCGSGRVCWVGRQYRSKVVSYGPSGRIGKDSTPWTRLC